MSDIVISAKNISKSFKSFSSPTARFLAHLMPSRATGLEEVHALKDVTFEVRKGDSLAILGRNGGGKSTLLQILTGTLSPTQGEIVVKGRVSALLELGSGFNPEYSGRDNVILNGLLLGLRRDEILLRFGEIEAFADIGNAIDRPVKTYSSGMMMRLAFAVQVICDPEILIIDEALSVGDFFFQQKCLAYIRSLKEKGVTLLFVSHDMGAVRDICDRGLYLSHGHLVYDGDNLTAIRYYLQGDSVIPAEEAPRERTTTQTPNEKSKVIAENSVWTIDPSQEAAAQEHAVVTSVTLYSNQQAVAAIDMDSWVTVRIACRVLVAGQYHVHFEIKNKQNQIVFSVGSQNLNLSAPTFDVGDEMLFDLDIQFAFEAGEYAFCAQIVQPATDHTTGIMVDKTPWIGPIPVHWDYYSNKPRFFGLFGANCTGKFA
ncbi:ATP-binding cassette domain-containing protein [Rhizobium sp. CFBP 8762]|uniref:ABC transporter ATP-binding protein n=1 Tax=Rhizobium sp. CFBP 8762 TaxID=2775279 RepID=UPI001784C011|nr:polysaccharide ABC transporter ATP-binding protein [Rhizobium sp. CFBP 8762]MBD8554667.1 ATP-binding cassette domain-containing protein [Rhizobium sp. CFBP 8762]